MIAALVLGAALVTGPGRHLTGPGPNPVVHVVAPGDTLWSITGARWGNPRLWPRLYAANRRVIGSDPNWIIPGERLRLTLSDRPAEGRATRNAAPGDPSTGGGTLSCSGLERLWVAAGGPGWAAFTAAEVAMAESGGRQYATGPAGERGYWQIHPDHGALSTYDPYGNARAAVIISSWGRDWSAWTTYVDGAYRGLC